jgi:predicted nucleic acid-binding protein
MVLIDTSVWIDHLRQTNRHLSTLLEREHVYCHAFVIGELACGNLQNRAEILALLRMLAKACTLTHNEVLSFIENHDLMGKGLGYIDIILLASTMLTDCLLWTRDKALANAAKELEIGYDREFES